MKKQPGRKHIRLRDYDYSSKGRYFVTICTGNRRCFLGKIENKTWYPSAIGKQAELFWDAIPRHFTHVELGKHVIMPNHIHGVIGIGDAPYVGTPHGVSLPGPHDGTNVGTSHGMSLRTPLDDISWRPNQFGKTIPGSLSAIVCQFKSTVTRWCNTNNQTFKWQGRFYDHIIRDEEELVRINNYIDNNINNWEDDQFYFVT